MHKGPTPKRSTFGTARKCQTDTRTLIVILTEGYAILRMTDPIRGSGHASRRVPLPPHEERSWADTASAARHPG